MISTEKLLRRAIFDATNTPEREVDDDGDFDPEDEYEACTACEEDGSESGNTFDGDFKGHPFRGNQYEKSSRESGAAVHASRRAKHAEKNGDKKSQKSAHKSAYFSHSAAAEVAKTKKAVKYHKIMAKFHAGRAGVPT